MIKIATSTAYLTVRHVHDEEMTIYHSTKQEAVEAYIEQWYRENSDMTHIVASPLLRLLAAEGQLSYEPEEVVRFVGARKELFDTVEDAVVSMARQWADECDGCADECELHLIRRLVQSDHINYEVVSDVKLETVTHGKQWVVNGVKYDDKGDAMEAAVTGFLSTMLHRDLIEEESAVVTLMMAYDLIKVEEVVSDD